MRRSNVRSIGAIQCRIVANLRKALSQTKPTYDIDGACVCWNGYILTLVVSLFILNKMKPL